MKHNSAPSFPTAVSNKRQRVDATHRLLLEQPDLMREHRLLTKVLSIAVRALAQPGHRLTLKTQPALYSRYRGTAFPLKDFTGRKLLRWRSLSPWMKTQIAGLCLGETRSLQVRFHPHSDIQVQVGGLGLKVYLRDRLVRCLRSEFGYVPWFYFVIEDQDTEGAREVRPHVHGAIQIPRAQVPTLKDRRPTARYQRVINKSGIEEAEYLAGREKVNRALKRATGNDGTRPGVVQGISQLNNIWKRKPYNPLRNPEWVSYALKNVNVKSLSLPENRLSMTRSLNQEAQRLWSLIRDGEPALTKWP